VDAPGVLNARERAHVKLVLRGLTVAEIARKTCRTRSAAHQAIERAIRKLRKHLGVTPANRSVRGAAVYASHVRLHVKHGVVNPECPHCAGQSFTPAPTDT